MTVKQKERIETEHRDGEVWANRYLCLQGGGETWGPQEFESEMVAHLTNIALGIFIGKECTLQGHGPYRYLGPRIKRRA